MNDMDYRLLDGAVSDAYACLDRLTSMIDKLAVVRRDAAGWRSAGGAATLDATSAERAGIVGVEANVRQCERDAAADWVEAHGGLDAVAHCEKQRLEYGWQITSIVERLGFCSLAEPVLSSDDRYDRIMAELDKRLMPMGLSWPRWPGGAPVTKDDAPKGANVVALYLDGSGYGFGEAIIDHDGIGCGIVKELHIDYAAGERIARPKRDGVPLGARIFGRGAE